ncbi:MAG: hypothetical protein O3A36_03455 [bacterium]|nr:hypothetical protein [bacterium]
MNNILALTIRGSKVAQLLLAIFIILSGWWITIFIRGLEEGTENNIFTLVYPILALIGSVSGFVVSKKWGGVSSVIGKGILLFSLGLFAQFFGQAAYAYYIYIEGIEIPYPSIGDIGYFGSVILYFFGLVSLAKVTGVKLSLKSYQGQIQALLIPVALLLFSYYLLLRDYTVDWSASVVTLLDFAYPLGQAIYVSMAILIYTLSRKFLSGFMRGPILFLLVSLVVQYISDFTFLYQVGHDQWYVGGVNDYMYSLSYVLMAIALIQIGSALNYLREEI